MPDGIAMNVDTMRLELIIATLPRQGENMVAGIATEMVNDMKQGMLNSPADGITYTRGGVSHTSSSPGNPPRPDTGELVGSITHTKTGVMEQTIHDQVEHGKWQELGTEFIEARPWMVPVFEEWRVGKFANFVNSFPLVE
ncbi:hypothetical protein C8B47_10795 [filamentous cyanobacterium CCP4]|nr:hypothetical protein C8B47_10795 [filamentous cyanobacterium CCP4]